MWLLPGLGGVGVLEDRMLPGILCFVAQTLQQSGQQHHRTRSNIGPMNCRRRWDAFMLGGAKDKQAVLWASPSDKGAFQRLHLIIDGFIDSIDSQLMYVHASDGGTRSVVGNMWQRGTPKDCTPQGHTQNSSVWLQAQQRTTPFSIYLLRYLFFNWLFGDFYRHMNFLWAVMTGEFLLCGSIKFRSASGKTVFPNNKYKNHFDYLGVFFCDFRAFSKVMTFGPKDQNCSEF